MHRYTVRKLLILLNRGGEEVHTVLPASKASERIAYANSAPRCQHVKANGEDCGCPARHGEMFCHFHDLAHVGPSLEVPIPENWSSIQIGLYRVMRGLMDRTLDGRTAGRVLYALQIAAASMARFQQESTAAPQQHDSIAAYVLERLGTLETLDRVERELGEAARLVEPDAESAREAAGG
jgi:hypothetical protein